MFSNYYSFLLVSIILQKKGCMSIYRHILYIIIYVYICLYIFIHNLASTGV